ncbi:F-box protein-like protein [Drosera capensis]
MSTFLSDLSTRLCPEPQFTTEITSIDDQFTQFDRIPDSLLLVIFNKIGDVKSLGRCSLVSRRFHSLIPQVDNVVVLVDCVISDDDDTNNSSSDTGGINKSRSPFVSLFRSLFCSFFKRIAGSTAAGGGGAKRVRGSAVGIGGRDEEDEGGVVTHHSPAQVLRSFNEIRVLRIELPNGELGVDDGVLLRWRAGFGSTLDSCVILGASSVTRGEEWDEMNSSVVQKSGEAVASNDAVVAGDENNGSIPESFYTNGGLKLRVVWTISSLIAAAGRHYLLQPIIAEHGNLDKVELTDADGQGVLCMNRDQLDELRVKPLSASSASKRTQVPALNLRLWYAPQLELPGGVVLKGATLVAIRPSEQSGVVAKREASDLEWIKGSFEEPYGTAARMLVKGRTIGMTLLLGTDLEKGSKGEMIKVACMWTEMEAQS